MTDTIILQLTSILAYLITLFVLYRLLVSQKDATIEVLKEKINFLEKKLSIAESHTPLVIGETLERRLHLTEDEVIRLQNDIEKYKQQIRSQDEKIHSMFVLIFKLGLRLEEEVLKQKNKEPITLETTYVTQSSKLYKQKCETMQ